MGRGLFFDLFYLMIKCLFFFFLQITGAWPLTDREDDLKTSVMVSPNLHSVSVGVFADFKRVCDCSGLG